jgi:hypothetical protein
MFEWTSRTTIIILSVVWGLGLGLILGRLLISYLRTSPPKSEYFVSYVGQAKEGSAYGNGTIITDTPLQTIEQIRAFEKSLLEDFQSRYPDKGYANLSIVSFQLLKQVK